MHSFIWDLSQASRALLRARSHAIPAVLTLATGIGSAATLFSIVHPVLLASPPYPSPDRLAYVWEREEGGATSNLGYATIADVGRDSKSIASWAALSFWQPTVQLDGRAELLIGQRVSANYFATLGVRPMLGRDFAREEDTQATRSVVILSHGLWQRAYRGDSQVVGGTVTISGRSFTVAGVMPPTFENIAAPTAEVWAPLGYDTSLDWACRTCRHLRMIVRLRDGVSLASAGAEVDALLQSMGRTHPTEYASASGTVQGIQDAAVGRLRPVMLVLLGAVGFILLIACANVANLVLGRAVERQGEFSLRVALGAPASRLVRQVTAETMLLALAGGALGLLLAAVGVRLLPDTVAATLPRAAVARLDGNVVAFAVVAALVSTVAAGLIPAWFALRGSVAGAVREGARAILGRKRHRVRTLLVMVEVSLAIVLLTGSGLLLRTMDHLLQVRTGYDAAAVGTLTLSVSGPRYSEDAPTVAYFNAALAAARATPGVVAAAVTSQLPLGGNFDGRGIHRVDRPSANPSSDPSAQRFAVSPDYLRTMGIALLAGRGLEAADRAGATRVALINRAMAATMYAGEDPLGRAIHVGGADGEPHTIVGVVDDVRHLSLDAEPELQVYVPFDQVSAGGTMALVVRTSGAPGSRLGDLATRVQGVDPSVALSARATMREVVSRATGSRQLALGALGAFAILALVLSAAGMYGVIAATVAERRREIGVRAALGATRGRIVAMVVREAAIVSGVGLVVGGLGAVGGAVVLRSMLFGVAPWDAPTFAGVLAVLGAVAIAASAVPAWRAARVDPATVFRTD